MEDLSVFPSGFLLKHVTSVHDVHHDALAGYINKESSALAVLKKHVENRGTMELQYAETLKLYEDRLQKLTASLAEQNAKGFLVHQMEGHSAYHRQLAANLKGNLVTALEADIRSFEERCALWTNYVNECQEDQQRLAQEAEEAEKTLWALEETGNPISAGEGCENPASARNRWLLLVLQFAAAQRHYFDYVLPAAANDIYAEGQRLLAKGIVGYQSAVAQAQDAVLSPQTDLPPPTHAPTRHPTTQSQEGGVCRLYSSEEDERNYVWGSFVEHMKIALFEPIEPKTLHVTPDTIGDLLAALEEHQRVLQSERLAEMESAAKFEQVVEMMRVERRRAVAQAVVDRLTQLDLIASQPEPQMTTQSEHTEYADPIATEDFATPEYATQKTKDVVADRPESQINERYSGEYAQKPEQYETPAEESVQEQSSEYASELSHEDHHNHEISSKLSPKSAISSGYISPQSWSRSSSPSRVLRKMPTRASCNEENEGDNLEEGEKMATPVEDESEHSEAKLRKLETRRGHVIAEIISTESSFLAGLMELQKHFETPLREAAMDGKRAVIPLDLVNVIFKDVTGLIAMSKSLLEQLKQDQTVAGVARTFTTFAAFFRMFTSFSIAYAKNFSLVVEQRKNPRVDKWFQEHEAASKPFEILYITPNQRMPRYVLLLKDVAKGISEEDPNYQSINKAYTLISNMCNELNTKMKDADQSMRLVTMSAHMHDLPPNVQLVAPNRRFVRQDYARVYFPAVNKCAEQTLILCNDILVVATRTRRTNPGLNSPDDKCKYTTHCDLESTKAVLLAPNDSKDLPSEGPEGHWLKLVKNGNADLFFICFASKDASTEYAPVFNDLGFKEREKKESFALILPQAGADQTVKPYATMRRSTLSVTAPQGTSFERSHTAPEGSDEYYHSSLGLPHAPARQRQGSSPPAFSMFASPTPSEKEGLIDTSSEPVISTSSHPISSPEPRPRPESSPGGVPTAATTRPSITPVARPLPGHMRSTSMINPAERKSSLPGNIHRVSVSPDVSVSPASPPVHNSNPLPAPRPTPKPRPPSIIGAKVVPDLEKNPATELARSKSLKEEESESAMCENAEGEDSFGEIPVDLRRSKSLGGGGAGVGGFGGAESGGQNVMGGHVSVDPTGMAAMIAKQALAKRISLKKTHSVDSVHHEQ